MLTSFCYMPAVGIAMAGTTSRRTGDRRACAGLGFHGRQRHHPDLGRVHGSGGRLGGGRRALAHAVVHECRRSARPRQSRPRDACCCGLRRAISCSTASTSRAARACAARAMCAFPRSWCSRCRGRCSCRWPTRSRSSRARDGSIGCRNSVSASVGGWFAALIYICCLGLMLYLRWRSGAWRRVVLR